jgi:hypothetical protein
MNQEALGWDVLPRDVIPADQIGPNSLLFIDYALRPLE